MENTNRLPYSSANPVLYDNDSHEDMYTDEYLLALASSGDINLRGMVTSASYVDAWQQSDIQYAWQAGGREELVEIARRSGLRNIPHVARGPSLPIKKPTSGKIEDAVPHDTPGSRLIIEEAKRASPDKPLVIVMGGQGTAVASAYLLDNSIKDNIIVAWLVCETTDGTCVKGYNGEVDRFATYIIASRMKLVAFGPDFWNTADVPKKRLIELPETELRQYMIQKNLPHVNLPDERDIDVQAAISLMRPDYVKQIEMKSVSGFGEDKVIRFKNDKDGNIWMVTKLDKDIATGEWWRALKNPAVWGQEPVKPVSVPYNKRPFPIPGTIAAEQFDFGGEGVSYHSNKTKSGSLALKSAFRVTEPVWFLPSKQDDDLMVDQFEENEWLAYSLNVAESGIHRIEIHAAATEQEGEIHLDLDGADLVGPIKIPTADNLEKLPRITAGKISLSAGDQVLRLSCDKGPVNIDRIRFIKG